MRIRAVSNGNEIEWDDAAAKELIAAGIYEAVTPAPKPAPPPPKRPAPEKPTKVEPLTTEDMPSPPRTPKRAA